MALVPLISSGVSGPLGVIHLPRLWQKLTLGAKGQLAEGYDQCGMGFDQMVLDGLKIDRAAAVAFISDNSPTYPQFEAWVVQQRGGNVPQGEIDALNAAVRGYNHDDDTRKAILDGAGIADDGSILDAIGLNNLEDWSEFHSSL
jgi:hypothetical protein